MGADVKVGEGRRRYRTPQEKRQIVEQTLSSGLSVASVAREHGVNANQVFYWRSFTELGSWGATVALNSRCDCCRSL